MIGDLMLRRLNELRLKNVLCDLQLVSNDNKLFNIHQVVFTALNRKHFMLAIELQYAYSSDVKILSQKKMYFSQLSANELELLIDFMYGGVIKKKYLYDILVSTLGKLDMKYLLDEVQEFTFDDEPLIKVEHDVTKEMVVDDITNSGGFEKNIQEINASKSPQNCDTNSCKNASVLLPAHSQLVNISNSTRSSAQFHTDYDIHLPEQIPSPSSAKSQTESNDNSTIGNIEAEKSDLINVKVELDTSSSDLVDVTNVQTRMKSNFEPELVVPDFFVSLNELPKNCVNEQGDIIGNVDNLGLRGGEPESDCESAKGTSFFINEIDKVYQNVKQTVDSCTVESVDSDVSMTEFTCSEEYSFLLPNCNTPYLKRSCESSTNSNAKAHLDSTYKQKFASNLTSTQTVGSSYTKSSLSTVESSLVSPDIHYDKCNKLYCTETHTKDIFNEAKYAPSNSDKSPGIVKAFKPANVGTINLGKNMVDSVPKNVIEISNDENNDEICNLPEGVIDLSKDNVTLKQQIGNDSEVVGVVDNSVIVLYNDYECNKETDKLDIDSVNQVNKTLSKSDCKTNVSNTNISQFNITLMNSRSAVEGRKTVPEVSVQSSAHMNHLNAESAPTESVAVIATENIITDTVRHAILSKKKRDVVDDDVTIVDVVNPKPFGRKRLFKKKSRNRNKSEELPRNRNKSEEFPCLAGLLSSKKKSVSPCIQKRTYNYICMKNQQIDGSVDDKKSSASVNSSQNEVKNLEDCFNNATRKVNKVELNFRSPSQENKLNCLKSSMENDLDCLKSSMENDSNCLKSSTENDSNCLKSSMENNSNCLKSSTENGSNCLKSSTENDSNCLKSSMENDLNCTELDENYSSSLKISEIESNGLKMNENDVSGVKMSEDDMSQLKMVLPNYDPISNKFLLSESSPKIYPRPPVRPQRSLLPKFPGSVVRFPLRLEYHSGQQIIRLAGPSTVSYTQIPGTCVNTKHAYSPSITSGRKRKSVETENCVGRTEENKNTSYAAGKRPKLRTGDSNEALSNTDKCFDNLNNSSDSVKLLNQLGNCVENLDQSDEYIGDFNLSDGYEVGLNQSVERTGDPNLSESGVESLKQVGHSNGTLNQSNRSVCEKPDTNSDVSTREMDRSMLVIDGNSKQSNEQMTEGISSTKNELTGSTNLSTANNDAKNIDASQQIISKISLTKSAHGIIRPEKHTQLLEKNRNVCDRPGNYELQNNTSNVCELETVNSLSNIENSPGNNAGNNSIAVSESDKIVIKIKEEPLVPQELLTVSVEPVSFGIEPMVSDYPDNVETNTAKHDGDVLSNDTRLKVKMIYRPNRKRKEKLYSNKSEMSPKFNNGNFINELSPLKLSLCTQSEMLRNQVNIVRDNPSPKKHRKSKKGMRKNKEVKSKVTDVLNGPKLSDNCTGNIPISLVIVDNSQSTNKILHTMPCINLDPTKTSNFVSKCVTNVSIPPLKIVASSATPTTSTFITCAPRVTTTLTTPVMSLSSIFDDSLTRSVKPSPQPIKDPVHSESSVQCTSGAIRMKLPVSVEPSLHIAEPKYPHVLLSPLKKVDDTEKRLLRRMKKTHVAKKRHKKNENVTVKISDKSKKMKSEKKNGACKKKHSRCKKRRVKWSIEKNNYSEVNISGDYVENNYSMLVDNPDQPEKHKYFRDENSKNKRSQSDSVPVYSTSDIKCAPYRQILPKLPCFTLIVNPKTGQPITSAESQSLI
ncbi:hypothetical protein ACF0H5_003231 [Mactra antiquata]